VELLDIIQGNKVTQRIATDEEFESMSLYSYTDFSAV